MYVISHHRTHLGMAYQYWVLGTVLLLFLTCLYVYY